MKPYLYLSIVFVLFSACEPSASKRTRTSNIETVKGSIGKTNTEVQDNQKTSESWSVDNVTGSIIKFRNGTVFDTHLYNCKYIGQVPNDNTSPFLIVSGTDCDECDENISIYIHSPSNGQLKVENGENRYQMPGTERDFETKQLLYKARAFYGEVLPHTRGVLWYQEQLMENNSWRRSLYLVSLIHGVKQENELKDRGRLQQTLELLKQGRCKEITGTNYLSEP
jgi:hypothetical protein